MKDKIAVAFILAPPRTEGEQTPLASLVGHLKREFESADFVGTEIKLSSLGYGAFSLHLSEGRASIVVWPIRGHSNHWQIWIVYVQSRLKRLFRVAPPDDVVEKLERIQSLRGVFC